MTTTTATAPATTRIHELELRVSDEDGLWAELVGHARPAPLPDEDCLAVPPDAADPCNRRGCTRPAARYLAGHRPRARRDWRELVGLCVHDFGAHWAGETFLVRADTGGAPARRERHASVSRRILADRYHGSIDWERTGGEASEEYEELSWGLNLIVHKITGRALDDDEETGQIVDDLLASLGPVVAAAVHARIPALTL